MRAVDAMGCVDRSREISGTLRACAWFEDGSVRLFFWRTFLDRCVRRVCVAVDWMIYDIGGLVLDMAWVVLRKR